MRNERPYFVVAVIRPDVPDWEEKEDQRVVDWIDFNEGDTFDEVEGALSAGFGIVTWLADAAKRKVFDFKFDYDDFVVQKVDRDGDICAEYDSEGEPIWE